jgi:hypothetical protein
MIVGDIIFGGDTIRQRWSYNRATNVHSVLEMHKKMSRPKEAITFSEKDGTGISQPYDDVLVLSVKMNTHRVRRILIDTGSSTDIMYFDVFIKMGYNPLYLVKVNTPLVGFTGVAMVLEGLMRMRVEFSTPPRTTSLMINFLIVKAPSTYNIILGRKILYELGATISMSCLKIKFLTPYWVGEECGDQQISRDCYVLSLKGRDAQVNRSTHSLLWSTRTRKTLNHVPPSNRPMRSSRWRLTKAKL